MGSSRSLRGVVWFGAALLVFAAFGWWLAGGGSEPAVPERAEPSGPPRAHAEESSLRDRVERPLERMVNPMSLGPSGGGALRGDAAVAARPGAVTLRLLDTKGRPVVHQFAHVVLSWDPENLLAGVTDASGRYRLSLSPPDPTAPKVRAPDPADDGDPDAWGPQPLRENSDRRLPAGGFARPEVGAEVSLTIGADVTQLSAVSSPIWLSFEMPRMSGCPLATVTFRVPPEGEELDLGDLQLQHAPVFAVGRILGSDGTPPPHVIWHWVENGRPQDVEVASRVRPQDTYVRLGPGAEFRVYGPMTLEQVELWARDPRRQERSWQPVILRRGATGAMLRLQPERQVEVTFDVTNLDPDAFDVPASLGVAPIVPHHSWLPRLEPNGASEMPGVVVGPIPPGYHDLVIGPPSAGVLSGADRTGRVRIPRVWVPATGEVTDPRVRAVRVR